MHRKSNVFKYTHVEGKVHVRTSLGLTLKFQGAAVGSDKSKENTIQAGVKLVYNQEESEQTRAAIYVVK